MKSRVAVVVGEVKARHRDDADGAGPKMIVKGKMKVTDQRVIVGKSRCREAVEGMSKVMVEVKLEGASSRLE